jgi:carbamoyl-phosphate synthase small subunit
MNHTARLALADGAVLRGSAFGATGRRIAQTAEVVFNTAMSGYQESITDPSYTGQILVFTAPLIGNTGVNEEDVESSKVQVAGMVCRELAQRPSNFRSTSDLSEYLARHNALGIQGIDTRALTKRLRTTGAMPGIITDVPESELSDAQLVDAARKAPSMNGQNLVPLVGCTNSSRWSETLGEWSPRIGENKSGGRRFRVLALDCGAKRNILRNLADRGCDVEVVPHDVDAADVQARFKRGQADGLFISNGPGDPAAVDRTIASLRAVLADRSAVIPTFGICLGHQLLCLALGGETYKLKFGHRGLNQPVLNLITGRVEITSQNHGFAVNPESLAKATGGAGQTTHINLNDHTLAGFCLSDRPVFAVQHHPEASPGPHDATYLFDAFVRMMDNRAPLTLAQLQQTGAESAAAVARSEPARAGAGSPARAEPRSLKV